MSGLWVEGSGPTRLYRANKSVRVLILERDPSGHRLTVVRVLIEALVELMNDIETDISITLATTSLALATAEYKNQISDIESTIDLEILPDLVLPTHPLKVAFRKLLDWYTLVRTGSFDHIYVPYGDGLIQLSVLSRLVPGVLQSKATATEAVLMRGSFGYSNARWLTKVIALTGLRYSPFSRIHLNDPVPFQWLVEKGVSVSRKVRLLPDPITPTPKMTRRAARDSLSLDQNMKWVGCVGPADERKGIDLLLQAFSQANLGSNVGLFLAGKQSAVIREKLKRYRGLNIISIDRYLDEGEFVAAISALDVVVTPYPEFLGSASMVIRAASAERFCLAANQGWMRRIVTEMNLGRVCNVRNIDEFAEALRISIEDSADYRLCAKGRAFVEFNSSDNIKAHWTKLLRERFDLPTDSRFLDWPE